MKLDAKTLKQLEELPQDYEEKVKEEISEIYEEYKQYQEEYETFQEIRNLCDFSKYTVDPWLIRFRSFICKDESEIEGTVDEEGGDMINPQMYYLGNTLANALLCIRDETPNVKVTKIVELGYKEKYNDEDEMIDNFKLLAYLDDGRIIKILVY